jgi:altronate hydrolase
MKGYLRQDGREGIRNVVIVAYLIECARHVANDDVLECREQDADLIGFPGCFYNTYAFDMMSKLCTHPNVGAVLLVSLGCEGFNREGLAEAIAATGRPVETLVIQEQGGTAKTIEKGCRWVSQELAALSAQEPVEMAVNELVIGTICGGSDGTSGITANPTMGRAFDLLISDGAICIFEETGELIGCEHYMADRAATPELGAEIIRCIAKARNYYETMGYGSFSPGNADGGLSTIEEKSMGAYAKSGTTEIVGLIKPGDQPLTSGLYLLDVIPDGEVRHGFPNINDNAEIAELIACGAHLNLFSTGRGSVVGSAISPVIKVCGNPETYRRMADDMDVNAGRILKGDADLDEVGVEIRDLVLAISSGQKSKSEALGHREFILTYKTFDPIGPACLPNVV